MSDAPQPVIVLHRHLRALGYCNRGIKAFCAARGIDWPALLRDGISADELERHGDAMAGKAIALARQEQRERARG